VDPILYLSQRLNTLLPGRDHAELITKPVVRRELTVDDPLLFALIYLSRHLSSDGRITLSEFHEALIAQARTWPGGPVEPREGRHAYIAPRASGKSTWAFLVLPLWAAAHGHLRFIAAFSDSATQAEQHLTSLKRELDTNELLRRDYPELCQPATRPSGVKVSDNRGLMQTASGFAFSAKGLDSGVLGLKVGSVRPDLLILDDIEPGEAQYSPYQASQRLKTVQDVVLPLNERARVMITGTVTAPGSLIHQMVLSGRGEKPPEQWVVDERISVHYWPAILKNPDGSRRSLWPEKWGLPYLESIEHTRSYAKNFQNLPVPSDGAYWTPADFTYATLTGVTRTVLSVDPAVTSTAKSDATGLAVVGWSPSMGRCQVEHAEEVRLAPGEPLRAKVLGLLAAYPHITGIHVESDQGGDLWRTVFHDMPVRVTYAKANQVTKGSKAERAAKALARYQQGQVVHTSRLRDLEDQMCFFTGREGAADDLVDAVVQAVNGFMPAASARPGMRVTAA
jgi:hypothetical protein